jgi:hypothetical protein
MCSPILLFQSHDAMMRLQTMLYAFSISSLEDTTENAVLEDYEQYALSICMGETIRKMKTAKSLDCHIRQLGAS